MIVVASANGRVGMQAAIEILRNGGTALDAVEAATRLVEANPEDHSVGANSYPNILGTLELDACIMNGQTLETGAVAAMQGTTHAISVARKVMEHLPHVLLAGEGARRFSAEMGFPQETDLVSDDIMGVYRRKLEAEMPDETIATLDQQPLADWVRLATDPKRVHSTVNFLAKDSHGNIASAVSTSGWSWKYPGRVGDSPIIGAGNYCDSRYGAAACTGMGEMAIRANTAHSLVFYMKMGLSVEEAAQRSMEDLRDLGGDYIAVMNLVAMDKDGNHTACTSMEGRTYVYQSAEMDTYVEAPRQYVEIPGRWKS